MTIIKRTYAPTHIYSYIDAAVAVFPASLLIAYTLDSALRSFPIFENVLKAYLFSLPFVIVTA